MKALRDERFFLCQDCLKRLAAPVAREVPNQPLCTDCWWRLVEFNKITRWERQRRRFR